MQHVSSDAMARMGHGYTEIPFMCLTNDVKLGERVILRPFCNLYGCEIGDDTRIAAFVEIGRGVKIGARCKIQLYTAISGPAEIEDEVYIGTHVAVCNTRHPRAVGAYETEPTFIGKGASIGSGSILLPGVKIGAGAVIGAGTLVAHDVLPGGKLMNPRTARLVLPDIGIDPASDELLPDMSMLFGKDRSEL